MLKNIFLAFVFLSCAYSPANAYVDPGIMAGAYQLLYMLFFGVIVGIVTRPWLYIKSFFKKSAPKTEIGDVKD